MNAETKIAPELRAEPDFPPRPRSAVSGGVGVAGIAGLVAWVAIARAFQFSGPHASLCAVVACGGPMLFWSLFVDKVHRRASTGIDWQSAPRPLRESVDYSFFKIAGLWSTWAGLAFLYCMARWYWEAPYQFAMTTFAWAVGPLLALSVPYVLWLDRRLVEPRDGAWHFGQLLFGRRGVAESEKVYEHLRCWAIKGFFLAFMVAVVPGNWSLAITPTSAQITANLGSLTRWLIAAMFMIDTSFATIGYVLTMKPLDAHIRSANPYAAGWTAALICYPPFVLMASGGPLDYHPGTMGEDGWAYWLDGYPLLMTLFAFAMVVLTAIYAWATVAFGIRFSNLTHRGVLTHGPYAWTKHPAYLSKNLFWWLCTLPFFATTGNVTDSIRNTFIMGLVSGVYYWRARTEERHLSADPDYREYAAWMAEHGPITRLLTRRPRGSAPEPLPAE